MLPPVDPATVTTAVQIGRTAYQNTPAAKRLFSKLRATWFRKRFGGEKILIAGVGGAGKTTLHKILTGKREQASHTYRQTNVIERGSYQGSVFGKVITFPGQDDPFTRSTPSPSAQLVQSAYASVSGLIIVVANGHNNPQPGDNRSDPKILRKENLEKEKLLFESLVGSLSEFHRLSWIVLAVNKRDFWFSSERHCMKRYNSFADQIRAKLATTSNGSKVSVSIAPLSLMSSNIRDPKGGTIFLIDPQYDDAMREADFVQFTTRIDELAKSDQ